MKKTRCIYCEDETSSELQGLKLGEHWYCKHHYHKCRDCGKYHPNGYMIVVNGKYICGECLKNEYFLCEECGSYHNSSRKKRTRSGKIMCSCCYSNKYTTCNSCGKELLRVTECRINSSGDYICQECFDTMYRECTQCGRVYMIERGNSESFICSNCEQNPILSHSAKPRPQFKKTEIDKDKNELYFGFELEVQDQKFSVPPTDQAEWVRSNSYFYSKYDGSVGDGFEIVSHPFTWSHWRDETKNVVKKIQEKLTSDGYRSYNTTCCGLHIHMSKDSFTNVQLYKFMKLFYENEQFIYTISQRKTLAEMRQWASCSCNRQKVIRKAIDKSTDESRYNAVNLCNRGTIEIRIFKGTLNFNGFCKAMEFCKSMYEFTKVASIKDMKVSNFCEYITKLNKTYPNLYNFLCRKELINGEMLKVDEIGEVE